MLPVQKDLHLLAFLKHTLRILMALKNKENHVIPLLLPMDLVKWFHEESISRQKENKKRRETTVRVMSFM